MNTHNLQAQAYTVGYRDAQQGKAYRDGFSATMRVHGLGNYYEAGWQHARDNIEHPDLGPEVTA